MSIAETNLCSFIINGHEYIEWKYRDFFVLFNRQRMIYEYSGASFYDTAKSINSGHFMPITSNGTVGRALLEHIGVNIERKKKLTRFQGVVKNLRRR